MKLIVRLSLSSDIGRSIIISISILMSPGEKLQSEL